MEVVIDEGVLNIIGLRSGNISQYMYISVFSPGQLNPKYFPKKAAFSVDEVKPLDPGLRVAGG